MEFDLAAYRSSCKLESFAFFNAVAVSLVKTYLDATCRLL